MSSLIDASAEFLEEQLPRYVIQKMSNIDAVHAVDWLNARLQVAGNNKNIKFPLALIPAKGLSCFYGRKLIAVATLYLDQGGNVAVCGWLIANPENTPRQSSRAVRLLLEMMPQYVRDLGAKILMTGFSNRGINKIAASLGFIWGESSEMFFNVVDKGE